MLQHTAADGTRVAYYDWNTTAPGPAVVLQHGFASSTEMNWTRWGIVDVLAGAGRRVIGIDARGHGGSDKPRDPALYGEANLASDIRAIVSSLHVESYDLVGYSMGAIIAVNAAAEDPRVRRLVLGGVGSYLAERATSDGPMFTMSIADALEAEGASGIADPVAGWLRAFADRVGADRLALAALARSAHRRIALDRIAVPTLVLVGDADLFALGAEQLARAFPDARVEKVPGNHVDVLSNARYAERLLSFLS